MSEQRTSISAKVVADSFHNNSRLTTFEVTFPRFILAEFNTHRQFSRNSASSRAIPVWKRLSDIFRFPFVPQDFGKNKAGMQSAESVAETDADAARQNWLVGRDVAILQAFFLAGGANQIIEDAKGHVGAHELCDQIEELSHDYHGVVAKMKALSVGVHKQHANRVLEPYAWHTVIVTASQWKNFYALRASKMAQPEIQTLAIAMAKVHLQSVPRQLEQDEMHLPFIFPEDRQEVGDLEKLARISSARCARVSYLTHDGKRSLDADLSMADGLQGNGHMSPFEHPATAAGNPITNGWYGNFSDRWIQYRKMLDGEHDFSSLITPESLLEGMKGDQELVDFVLALPN